MSEEPKSDKPDQRRLSYATGCLLSILCGIAGVALGWYLGAHYRVELQAQIQAQAADILRAKGRIVDERLILKPFALVWSFWGGALGWFFGWLLTAFIPCRRTRTRRDYLLVVSSGCCRSAR
jgi:hypothetical protein